ncbi:type 1 glutamine amidotransferase domain-containing protein [Pseudomaricurvus sp.]|uniref:type 1 glutamine amidotransferase domain-containing protein n=1 Tax=Pseudomaricurvus sp. TaxID=2004510 RepID=UPI003F6C3187
MNMTRLKNTKVAILATHGFEQSELMSPLNSLAEAGSQVEIIAPDAGDIRGWDDDDWGDSVTVNQTLEEAKPENYDALILPGGVLNPDQLRINEKAITFIKSFLHAGKVVAAICHGPWLLINAGAARDLKVTSFKSIRTDLENAGAQWVDEEVVVDSGIVTSRTPEDLPAFTNRVIEEITENIQRRAA